jgi:hypothetical protein
MVKFRKGLKQEPASYDYLKGRLDSEALLESLGIDIGFRQRENQLMCHCPNLTGNHNNEDSSPSFGFNEEHLVYNCFVCGGGNVVELVWMMMPDLARKGDSSADYSEAWERGLRYLEQFADLNVSQDDLVDRLKRTMYPEQKDDELPDYPADNLFQYRKIHPYLYERGLTKGVIVEMEVGFDEEHAGITIPHWFMGKLVGMQRRHLAQDTDGNFICDRCFDPDKPTKKIPKYKNTSSFPKVNTLYGYDKMKHYLAQQGGGVIVNESPFSTLKLKSLGYHKTVGTFGQFSIEQGMLLLPCEKVYFWPDNDKAGYENAKRAAESMLGQMGTLYIVPVLPNYKGDPGDLNEASEVATYLKHAWPSSLWSLYTQDGLPTLEKLLELERAHTN